MLWGKHQRNFATAELFCATTNPTDIVHSGFGLWSEVRHLRGYFWSEIILIVTHCDIVHNLAKKQFVKRSKIFNHCLAAFLSLKV